MNDDNEGRITFGQLASPALGAFFFGAFPGVLVIYEIARHTRIDIGISGVIGLHVLFACLGSVVGAMLFRAATWTAPRASDIALVFGWGLIMGLVGFLLLVVLVPGT
jgi:hypothetical protein